MRFSKSFRVFAFSLLATIILIVITSAILSLFYEKAVIRYMKKYLDEHLLTQLSMDDIKFRVLKGFPNATMEITNAVLLSGDDFARKDFPGSSADTLLKAKSILLQFNLLKFFNKDYELKKIEVSQANVNILFDKQNKHNLKIWKTAGTNSNEYSVDLRSISLIATHINLISLREQLSIAAFSEKTNFRGAFTGNVFSGDTRATLVLRSLMLNNKKLANNATLRLSLKMIYSGNRFRISQGKVLFNKALVNLEGEYKGGKGSSIDLTLNIPKFGLGELMSMVPYDMTALTGNFEFTGNGKLNAVIRGSLTDRKDLLIRSAFELTNCRARNIISKTDINKITLRGTVSGTRPDNFTLKIDLISSRLGKGAIDGTFSMHNLNDYHFRAEVHASIDLKALKDFTGIDTIETMHGIILSDFIASGNLKRSRRADSAATGFDFLEKGTFVFQEAGIKFKDLPVNIEHITGKATWGNIVQLDSLSLSLNETKLLIGGQIQHLKGYLNKKDLLKLNLEVITDNLNINKYLNKASRSNSSGKYNGLSIFPTNIYLKAHVKAKEFVAGKFKASDLSFNMSSLKDSVYIDNFFLRFPDGSISGNALITSDSEHLFSITCNAQPQIINIQQLFTAFNNFTQHFIVDKNVKGRLSGSVSFFAQWDSTLKFIPQSMKAKGDFKITNGELVAFEPMMKLSKYIDIDELRLIRFSTLKNSIFISDRLISIPEMAIHSTAFNISVSGQHSFDNVFDYRLKVLLSDVLFNKARKKKREIDDFFIEENSADQTTIPLIIAGTPDKYDVRFDKKRAFSLTRSKMQDNAVPGVKKPAPGNFKIEWDEPEEKARENKPVINKAQSDFVIEWDEEDSVENK